MGNATAQVSAFRLSEVLNRKEQGELDAAAGTIYNGVILGRDSSGYFTGADDTQALTECGMHIGQRQKVDADAADGYHEAEIIRGCIAKIKIATLSTDAAARAAYGRAVFAKYTDEVSLSPGTYGNFLGWIVGHTAGTYTEVYVYIPPMTSAKLSLPKCGSFTTPFDFNDDEPIEVHGAHDNVSSSKALMRIRLSTTQTKTGGEMKAVHAQAYVGAAGQGHNVYGLLAEAGLKAGATNASSTYGLAAARFKVEDAQATDGTSAASVWTGKVATLVVEAQVSSAVTGRFDGIYFNCQSAGAGTPTAWDAVFAFQSGGQNQSITDLFYFPSVGGFLSADTGNTGDASTHKLQVHIGGTAAYIALFADY